MTLTAHSTIGEWMNDATGGPLIRGLFEQTGADPELLPPVLGLPLQQLVAMSQGQLPQSVVDDLVRAANGGDIPEDTGTEGWAERPTTGRFAGKTVIDCWRILPAAVSEVAEIVHLGRFSAGARVLEPAQ